MALVATTRRQPAAPLEPRRSLGRAPRSGSELRRRRLQSASLGLIGAAVVGLAAASVLRRSRGPQGKAQLSSPDHRRLESPAPEPADLEPRTDVDQTTAAEQTQALDPAALAAGRRLNRVAGILAFSVLADSGLEHFRGSFQNRLMFVPLAVSALTLGTSAHGTAASGGRHRLRHGTYAAALITGLIGNGFHLYNVTKRPGGFCWQNLFYGAPLGAPFALTLSALLGLSAEQVRNTRAGAPARIFGRPAGRALALLSSAGLLGTVGEAGLLHFRGAFQDPAMFLPVTVPPVGAGLIAAAVSARSPALRKFARGWLWGTALLGGLGVLFHTYGVRRGMGGWANWSQNLLNGPPLPAPPSFTALALAGIAALRLLEEHPDV